MDQPIRISDLVRQVQHRLRAHFSSVAVEGEISSFKQHASGHCYFVLKDESAQLRAVLWRSAATELRFRPADGMLVVVRAELAIYPPRGDIQLVVRSMREAGEGAMQKAFERLKRKLAAEGLFSADHKKGLPAFPESIGIVTSGSGAAVHDILTVLRRRYPIARVYVLPVRVQGFGAADAIANAIDGFNEVAAGAEHRVEVLVVGRGGGSAEDLWAFNEEQVARAIFRSGIPVVSAVGHETDVSIADFVADRRAATPSAAAELIVPDKTELLITVTAAEDAMTYSLLGRIEQQRQRLEAILTSYALRVTSDRLARSRTKTQTLAHRLKTAMRHALDARSESVAGWQRGLTSLDPGRPLRTGFALVRRHGKVVTTAAELASGDRVSLGFVDGEKAAEIAD